MEKNNLLTDVDVKLISQAKENLSKCLRNINLKDATKSQTKIKEYDHTCPYCFDSDLKEIDQSTSCMETTFFMKCLNCKKEFKVFSKWYVEVEE